MKKDCSFWTVSKSFLCVILFYKRHPANVFSSKPQSELLPFAETVVGKATGPGLSGGQVCVPCAFIHSFVINGGASKSHLCTYLEATFGNSSSAFEASKCAILG